MFIYNNPGLRRIALTASGNDYDAYTAAGSPVGPVILDLTVSSTIGGVSAPALDVTGFDPASRVTITVTGTGKVYGRGGAGGIRGGSIRDGQAGGTAINIDTYALMDVIVNSGGEIRGGGGGGGVGQYRETPACGGGGGGGGQGFGTSIGGSGDIADFPGTSGGNGNAAGPGSGGSGGASAGVSGGGGGSGGAWGSSGITGLNGTGGSEFLAAGAGGSAGKAVNVASGGGSVSLTNNGTVSGTVD